MPRLRIEAAVAGIEYRARHLGPTGQPNLKKVLWLNPDSDRARDANSMASAGTEWPSVGLSQLQTQTQQQYQPELVRSENWAADQSNSAADVAVPQHHNAAQCPGSCDAEPRVGLLMMEEVSRFLGSGSGAAEARLVSKAQLMELLGGRGSKLNPELGDQGHAKQAAGDDIESGDHSQQDGVSAQADNEMAALARMPVVILRGESVSERALGSGLDNSAARWIAMEARMGRMEAAQQTQAKLLLLLLALLLLVCALAGVVMSKV